MSEEVSATSTPVTGDITVDLPCMACRYNLRGLNAAGACPECGCLIEPSLVKHHAGPVRYGPPLRESDPRWVRAMAGGVLGLLLCGIAYVLAGPLGLAFDGRSLRNWRKQLVVGTLIWTAGAAFLWRLGRKEPGRFGEQSADRTLALRIAAAASCAAPLVARWFAVTSPGFFFVLALLLWSATTCLTWLRLRDLVRRLPDVGLRRQATALLWLMTFESVARLLIAPRQVLSDPSRSALLFFACFAQPGVPGGPADFHLAVSGAMHDDTAILLAALALLSITVWTFVFLARTATALFAAARAAERGATTPAVSPRKTAPSSPP